MNSHITSFLESMPNGDSSNTAPCPKATAISDSLTLPPVDLEPQSKDRQEIEPENIHEVPVERCRVQSTQRRPRHRRVEPGKDVPQCRHAAEQMQRVECGKDVEEGAAGVGVEEQTLPSK